MFAVTLAALLAGISPGRSQDSRSQQIPSNVAYKNTKLPADERVWDLLGRMTVEEKSPACWPEAKLDGDGCDSAIGDSGDQDVLTDR